MELDGRPAIADPSVRERIADWHARSQGLTYTRFRILTALSRGATPGPENSIAKVVNAAKLQEIASFGMDLLGMAGGVMDPELAPMHAMFQDALLSSPSHRIAGGTDEILRNIIAERVLGLPGDMRVDKDLRVQPIAERESIGCDSRTPSRAPLRCEERSFPRAAAERRLAMLRVMHEDRCVLHDAGRSPVMTAYAPP